MSGSDTPDCRDGIAIIGMSCRFPGARNMDEYWRNLRNGVESVTFFSDDELIAAGIDRAVVQDPDYVKARSILNDVDLFDASFFGLTAREAEITDPQHRVFLECAWEALEGAGCNAATFNGLVGVYAGTGASTYLLNNLISRRDIRDAVGNFQLLLGNDKDYLASRVSYKLNLKGPSMVVQTACSTSLVAVHLACESLLTGEIDLALAGAVSINLPQKTGYPYQAGGIVSPDGHCRTFDAKAQGTSFGSGAGVVVLKRLSDALADGDDIHAVIKGSAVNNDGSLKVTYTAPGVQGQAEVIAAALSIAGVEPDEISYVEAHGTATPLGDPIEIEAITKVFRAGTEQKNYCAIGSVKSNFGHLDTVAGLAGLIKTVLMLKHHEIVPSLHFHEPNPKIDFANSPFYVSASLQPWQAGERPRRAGVSSFGIGGTNAHLVVEEAPVVESDQVSRPYQLLLLSAKTSSALDAMTANLVEHLKTNAEISLADVAYTLQVGRERFSHRRMVTCSDVADAIDALEAQDERVVTDFQEQRERSVAFMFPGQGAQYVNMGRDLYAAETIFREQVDQCCDLLKPHLKCDLRDVLFPAPEHAEKATQQLNQTAFTQPALFVIEYALAKLWTSWGVQPAAMIGHSVGEYVAACLAGVLSLKDALALVAARGRLIQSLRRGSMLAVPLPPDAVRSLARGRLSLAAINGPSRCVLSGPTEMVETVRNELTEQGVTSQLLHTSHAFHSEEMRLILEPFVELVKRVDLRPPTIPYLSNVTGTWITAAEATSPLYWGRHLCETVRFADGIEELLKDSHGIFLEVGPGRTLTTFVQEHPAKNSSHAVLPSLRHPNDQRSDVSLLLNTVGRLWLSGMSIDWAGFHAEERRRRLTLPTYPFERQRYWIDPAPKPESTSVRPDTLPQKRSVENWFYVPSWKRSTPPVSRNGQQRSSWMVFVDECGIGVEIVKRLEQKGLDVITVNPQNRADYDALFTDLRAVNRIPGKIVHLWSVTPPTSTESAIDPFGTLQQRGFYSLLHLTQSLAAHNITTPIEIAVVSNQIQRVKDDETVSPGKATVLAPCKVIPQEFPNIVCRNIDIDVSPQSVAQSVDRLMTELMAQPSDMAVAWRGDERWVQTFDSVRLDGEARLREGGVYLITGGLGNVGMLLAQSLAQAVPCKLILTGRSASPEDQRLRTLEDLGAEVMVISADVSNEEQMRAALTQVYSRFGTINGVIHAAGNIKEKLFSSIEQTVPSHCDLHFQSKVHGLCVLDRVLHDQQLDFFLLVSSLSSTLGGLGLVAYSAANLFMDAFAQNYSKNKRVPFVSVNWDSFQNSERGESSGITRDEGIEVLQRVLTSGQLPQVIVSTTDLSTRVDQWIKPKSLSITSSPTQTPRPADTEVEQRVAAVWRRVLGAKEINSNDNFFDLGGNSLTALQVISELKKEFNVQITPISLFEAPTVRRLAKVINPEEDREQKPAQTRPAVQRDGAQQDIAIVGMAARYPGASNVDRLWQNLREGVESITFFSEEELLSAGVSQEVLSDPRYIRARPVLDGVELFDAAFFHYSPREAEMLDPQHRLFLECAWQALESAGYDSERYAERIGVFAGGGTNGYFLRTVGRDSAETVGAFQTLLGVEKDSLTTTVSYKLNLKGPSIAVQTFCSTSLVAVHLARQSLLSGECDMAMAGGVSVNLPQAEGYLHQEGVSNDGHCRAFDAKARGLILGSGVGIVVLKRLADALADGDTIHAVIKGSAINNDGSLKVGYTAPSVDGQAEVITLALAAAGIEAGTVSYIETHGAGTPLGDPIEFRALSKAFAAHTSNKNFCAIGSVKTNIGHADRAAGVAGLIKTALSLKHKLLPPSLNFEDPNPEIDFANSPFYVNTKLSDWTRNGSPRRAGVTSLGIGGTNAHVILEEPPAIEPSSASRPWQLLVLSARSDSALDTATSNLVDHLKQNTDQNLADVAYTLQTSRRVFNHRRVLICRDSNDAITALDPPDPKRVLTSSESTKERPVVFMFPGMGDHYVNMAREIYETEPIFRQHVDHCAELLKPRLGLDLREELFPEHDQASADAASSGLDLRKMLRRNENEAADRLADTRIAQAALFVIEYALAQLWMSWGIQPSAMIGYSMGEWVAACLAGVFSIEDALILVAERARMIQELPSGAMLAVPLHERDVQVLLDQKLSLSAVNGEEFCVVAGESEAVAELEQTLTERQLAGRRLQTSHAFHSQMMTPIVDPLLELLKTFDLKPPQIPFISTATGNWIQESEATDPGYWSQHLCRPIRFADGMRELWETRNQILLEIGPGQMLGSIALQLPASEQAAEPVVLASLRHSYERQSDVAFLLRTLGKLWMSGAKVNWAGFYADERRHRVPLPTYPFERKRCWIEQDTPLLPGVEHSQQSGLDKRLELPDWFYAPVWKQSWTEANRSGEECNWLLFIDSVGFGLQLAKRLEHAGQQVTKVEAGKSFDRLDANTYTVNPSDPIDYLALLSDLGARGEIPKQIVHLWTITPAEQTQNAIAFGEEMQERGFYSLVFLAQALGEQGVVDPIQIDVVSNNMHRITGDDGLFPEKATVLGPCKVIPQEYQNVTCRSLDIVLPQPGSRQETQLIQQLLGECHTTPNDSVIAYRNNNRWVQVFEPLRLTSMDHPPLCLRERGVYLITGGLGGLGLAMAAYLANTVHARLVLIGRSSLPPRGHWDEWLSTHDDQDRTSTRIRKVQALEQSGAEVLIVPADVTDVDDMRAVVTQSYERFGEINGVIHAAGVPGAGLTQLKTQESAARILAPKVRGTLVLNEVLKDSNPDFMVLISSNISITGGLGQVDYCAANAFLDSFAQANAFGSATRVVAIDWSAWQWDDWQEILTAFDPEVQTRMKQARAMYGIRDEEGTEALARILRCGLPQVVVSTQDFQAVIESHANFTTLGLMDQLETIKQSKPLSSRPILGTEFVAPRNGVEQQLAEMWEKLLGIDQVGVFDNFFELGGHSLLAIQLISRLRQTYQVELTLQSLLETPTIADTAVRIETILISRIDQLTEEEAQQLLSQ